MAVTKLDNLVNPEVMADTIAAQLPEAIKFSKIAKLDYTLVGQPGGSISVPKYAYIGDAETVAEGEDAPIKTLTATAVPVTIKKAAQAVELTDEAALCGTGNPVEEAARQLTMSLAAAVDNDALAALQAADTTYDGSAAEISYDGIVNALDKFEDEADDTEYILFVNPKQVTKLRKDEQFIDRTHYSGDVMYTGEIGMIAGARVVKSKRLKKTAADTYINPIVQVRYRAEEEGPEASEVAPALTIYLKREAMVEADRQALRGSTQFVGNVHYVASLSNDSKVVAATFKAEA